MPKFELVSDFSPAGDQPRAISELAAGVERGDRFQTLLGITGSGKSFTIAGLIAEVQRPTLILAPNKSLAAQLASEFREFFPKNRVEYFVSYYDYYQPEAYLPSTDTYIEKDSSINDEIDRLRHSATSALLSRQGRHHRGQRLGDLRPRLAGDVLDPAAHGERRARSGTSGRSCAGSSSCSTSATTSRFVRNKFRVRGDTIEIFPAYEERGIRVQLFGDEVERICVGRPADRRDRRGARDARAVPGVALRHPGGAAPHARSRASRSSWPSGSSGSRTGTSCSRRSACACAPRTTSR